MTGRIRRSSGAFPVPRPAQRRPLARRLRAGLWLLFAMLILVGALALGAGAVGLEEEGRWALRALLLVAAIVVMALLWQFRAWFEEAVRHDLEHLELQHDIERVLGAVSSAEGGDLTARARADSEALAPVAEGWNRMLEGIGGLVARVRRAGAEVSRAAARIERASAQMAFVADEQAAALEGIVRKIQALGQRALEINQVVEMISDVSAQTDTLALNAAIESSRAGAQGRGFALVADDIRKLAERTSAATRDVGTFVEGIRQAADEVARSTAEVQRVTRTTAEGARDTLGSAREMVEAARALDEAIVRFKVAASDATGVVREVDRAREDLERALRAIREGGPAAARAREAVEKLAASLAVALRRQEGRGP